ncbi:hypothetical protein ACFL4J_01885 [Candidatus Margulisiibacteriota bacterium]
MRAESAFKPNQSGVGIRAQENNLLEGLDARVSQALQLDNSQGTDSQMGPGGVNPLDLRDQVQNYVGEISMQQEQGPIPGMLVQNTVV